MKWPMVRLGDIADFRNGLNYNKGNFGKGLKVINVKDFQDRLIADLTDLEEINPDGIVRDECFIREGDILFVRSNGNRELIGRSMLVTGVREPVAHSAFSIKTRFTSLDVLPHFYAYLFRTSLIRTELSNRGGGTNISNLNQDILNSLEVPKPPLAAQRKISGVLSAYDDLIENNTRRIAILEEMAQAIYREWFVHFRFPGHEIVKLINSPSGKIPEGWKAGTLDDCCDFQEGYVNPSQKYSEYFGNDIKWLRAVDLNNSFVFDTTRKLSQAGFDSAGKSKLLFEPDTLAISKSGTIGRIGILKDYMCGNRAVINIKPKRNVCCNQFIFHTLLDYNSEIVQLATGSVQKNLYVSVLGAQKIVIPSSDILKKFEQQISPFAEQIAIYQRKSATLNATRDLLLPKLITGQLDVEELDIDTGEPLVATGGFA